jgi:hypothetical protein
MGLLPRIRTSAGAALLTGLAVAWIFVWRLAIFCSNPDMVFEIEGVVGVESRIRVRWMKRRKKHLLRFALTMKAASALASYNATSAKMFYTLLNLHSSSTLTDMHTNE